MKRTSLLEIRGLKARIGRHFLIEMDDLTIVRGETLCLVGHNGAGKTTALLALGGIIRPESGTVILKDESGNVQIRSHLYRKSVSMAFQEPLLLNAPVFDNVAMGLKIRNIRGKELKDRVHEYCELFAISHLLKRNSRTLSGGEARRVSLARSMAIRPGILLLDEPFSALDLPAREALLRDFVDILRKTGSTVLFSTHDRDEAIRLSDRITVINGGKIIKTGTPTEVMNDPPDEFTASFVGVETLLDARVRESNSSGFYAEVSGSSIEVAGTAAAGELVILGIRPENVILSLGKEKDSTSVRNSFRGRVLKVLNMGHYYRISLDCGFSLVSYITHHSLEEMGLREGMEITASVKATAIHILRGGTLPG